jgi:hypothetical protein
MPVRHLPGLTAGHHSGYLTAFIAYIGRFYGHMDSVGSTSSLTQARRGRHLRHHDTSQTRARAGQPVKLENVTGGIQIRTSVPLRQPRRHPV